MTTTDNFKQRASRELSVDELKVVSGGDGKITFQPNVIIKVIDKSSPVLFLG